MLSKALMTLSYFFIIPVIVSAHERDCRQRKR